MSSRPAERHLLHFDALSGASENETLTFTIAMQDHPVQRHTPETRAAAREANPLLRLFSDTDITHFAEVDLPSDAIAMGQITRSIIVDGYPVQAALGLFIHVPREGRRADMARAEKSLHPKLAWREGVMAGSEILKLIAGQPDLLHDVIDPFETAMTLIYQHPELVNLSMEGGGTVPSFILRQCIAQALRERSVIVERIKRLGADWCRYEKLMDEGKPVLDDEGVPYFTMVVDESVQRALPDPVGRALKYSQQFAELKDQTWTVQYGTTTEEDPDAAAAAQRPREILSAAQTKWQRKSLSSEHGVTFHGMEFQEPRAGGLGIDAMWSDADPNTPMTPDFVKDLLAGNAFLRVDTKEQEGAWRVDLSPKTPGNHELTQWVGPFGQNAGTFDLRLNGPRTDLSVVVAIKSTPMHLSRIHLGVKRDGQEQLMWSQEARTEPAGVLRVTMRNQRLRYLSAYAEFFDTGGRPMRSGPLAHLPLAARLLVDDHPTKRYVEMLPPVDTVFGIPILPPYAVTMNIPFPEGAAKMRLYYGGFGTGKYDEDVCPPGYVCTVMMNLVVPNLLLIAGAAEYKTQFIANLMKDRTVLYGVFALIAAIGSGTYIGLSQDPARAAKTVARIAGPMLLKPALKVLLGYLARRFAIGWAQRAIPYLNVASLALNAAVTAAQLGQTTAAIMQSPWVYDYEITRTFDLLVRLLPDPEFGRFPDHHDRLRVQVVYDSGAELRHADLEQPSGPISEPIALRFDDIPSGGKVKVLAFFYAANGWQSGAGASGWVEARGADGGSVRQVEFETKNELIPLDAKSVYAHKQSIEYKENKHRWKFGPAPTATIATAPRDPNHQILAWSGISVAQRPGMIGYAWQARGLGLPRDKPGPITGDPLFVVQNLSVLEDPSSRHAVSPVGFSVQSGITYDLLSANDGSGMSFFIDPSRGEFSEENLSGGYHLRRIALASQETPRFNPGSGESWGRFPRPMDSIVILAQGYAAGVTREAAKIYLLQLPEKPVGDKDAPMASLASGEGERDGLLSRPRAICAALDGRLLVLEDGNRRIQSFDFTGNPVLYFKSSIAGTKSAVMPLRDTGASTTYLDLSVEAKGFIFVLAYDGDGAQTTQYRVDIYQPDGTFLVSTPGVSAAKIAVDLARGMYTLNWETLRGTDGRTEPSVSMWLAPPPDPKGEIS